MQVWQKPKKAYAASTESEESLCEFDGNRGQY